MAVVGIDGLALQFTSEKLKNDVELVVGAVEKDELTLDHASEKTAVAKEARAFHYVSDEPNTYRGLSEDRKNIANLRKRAQGLRRLSWFWSEQCAAIQTP